MRVIQALQLSILALIILLIGCESESTKAEKTSQRKARAEDRIEFMSQVYREACFGQKVKDKDPQAAEKHRLFLDGVCSRANLRRVEVESEFNRFKPGDREGTREDDLKVVLDDGYEKAKLGAADEALAKTFKDELMAKVRSAEEEETSARNKKEKEAEELKKGRNTWKKD